jgi:hypothetical protein
MFKRSRILALALGAVVIVIAVSSASTSAATPTFVTNPVDGTEFFAATSATCGFPVYGHDTGIVTTMITTLPDGSVRYHDVVVKITTTFYSTDPDHTGTATTHPSGPFIETDHPDGSITMNSLGQTGHVTIPGEGLVWMETGAVKVEIDANGNVTEFAHGNHFPDHSGICPLL